MNIPVVLVILVTLYSVDALKCRSCMYMEGSSDNDIMKMVLDSMTQMSNKDCKDNAEEATEEECGQLDAGYDEWKCGKGDVTTSMSQEVAGSSLSASIRIISRGCAPTKSDEERYEIGCHPAETFKDQITGDMEQDGAPALGPLKGEFCLCQGDSCNGASGIAPLILLVLALLSLAYIV